LTWFITSAPCLDWRRGRSGFGPVCLESRRHFCDLRCVMEEEQGLCRRRDSAVPRTSESGARES